MDQHDPLAVVDRLREQLEENMQKLGKALRHWQIWEAEYEGLKEELAELPLSASESALSRVSSDYRGDLVGEKEIKELFVQENGWHRTSRQIIGLIDRRIDYVQRNVGTLKKQCTEIERKLNNIAVISSPEALDEEGLPIQDIYEELDDDGNVVASKVSAPGAAGSQILDVLQKAGLAPEDVPDGHAGDDRAEDEPEIKHGIESTTRPSPAQRMPAKSALTRSRSNTVEGSSPTQSAAESSTATRPRKKSVSFAANTKQETTAPVPMIQAPQTSAPTSVPIIRELSQLARGTFTDADRVVEMDAEENPVAVKLQRQPIDESPEAASLRRQMLEYNLREVGEIVAEMNLDDDDDDDEEEEYDEDDEDYDLDEQASLTSDADENEWGMSRNGIITEAYKAEMVELEQRLKLRMLHNVGPENAPPPEEGTSSLRASALSNVTSSHDPLTNGKEEKSVRLAETLDIAPFRSDTSTADAFNMADKSQNALPIKDTIMEREAAPEIAPNTTAAPRKAPSRFKASRQAAAATVAAQPMPHRSATNPLAARIIERPSVASSATSSAPTAEMDESRQIASEYYALRNKLVHREGGFSEAALADEDAEVTDDEVMPKKKVSLFKAARVRGSKD